jgi:hypothetical protein
MSFFKNLFTFVGKALAFIFLAFCLLTTVSELVHRENVGYTKKSEPQKIQPTIDFIHQNIKENPILSIQLGPNCHAPYKEETLFRVAISNHCDCGGRIVKEPSLCNANNSPSAEAGDDVVVSEGKGPSCLAVQGINKKVTKWGHSKVCVNRVKNWDFAEYDSANKTYKCTGESMSYCSNSGVCVASGTCPVNYIAAAENEQSLRDKLKLKDETRFTVAGSLSNTNQHQNLFLTKDFKDSRPVVGLYMSIGKACLDTSVQDAGHNWAGLEREHLGCGKYGVLPNLEILDTQNEWKVYEANNLANEVKTFTGFKEHAEKNNANLFPMKKFAVNAKPECHSLKNQTNVSAEYNMGELPNQRQTTNYITLGFCSAAIVIAIGFLFMQKQPYCGFYTLVILQVICFILASIQLAYAVASFKEIQRLDQSNGLIYSTAQNECFVNDNINIAWKDFAASVKSTYGGHKQYADLSVSISVTYIIIQILYALWFAVAFKCNKELKEEEEDEEVVEKHH